MKIKKILVSQPKPADPKSPYYELAEKNNLKLEFRPFIHVEGVEEKDFRKQKVNILDHSAVIFNSKVAIDHFFRLSDKMRLNIPDTMKYFCVSESIAVYLQKYIVYRKRKIFHSSGKFVDLLDILKKHQDEKFLVPLSDVHKEEIPNMLEANGFKFTRANFYATVSSDLSDINIKDFDILVFFSPQGIASLKHNFPEFNQEETKIAACGASTAQAVLDAGLRLDIQAPVPEAPSMPMALEQYIKKFNKAQKDK